MKEKIYSIVIISMIAILLAPFAQAVPLTTSNYQNGIDTNLQTNHVTQSRHLTVSLEESISVNTNDNKNLQNDPSQQISNSKIILLADNLPINTVHLDQKIMFVAQDNFGKLTTLDKISNPERIRFNGKSIVIEHTQTTQQDNTLSLYQNLAQQTFNFLYKQMNTQLIQSEIIISPTYITLENNAGQFQNNLRFFAHDITPTNNPILLVLLVPLSGYILIRSENEKLKIKNQTKFLSSFFIVILLSSTAVTPFSISGNYWWMAFADNGTTNETVSNSTTQNYTRVTLPSNNTTLTMPQNETTQNQTQINSNQTYTVPDILSNSTGIASSNFTSITNTTGTVNSTNNTNIGNTINNLGLSDEVSAAVQAPPGNITSSLGLSDSISAIVNGTSLTNSTDTTSQIENQTEQTVPTSLPNATQSFNFTTTKGTVGETDTQNGTLQLQGQGYLIQQVNDTNTLKALTISAWVQPDYTQGSAIFTVISKENQFALTINNNINPKQIAQFSVYDGVKWNTVNSTITIPQEDWTHLAATYNGTDLAVYVNGTFQSSLRLPGVLTLTDDGHLTPITADHISSNSDVVIGAQFEAVRNDVRNQFSGQIRNVNLYSTLLDQSQIFQLYQQDSGNQTQITPVLPSQDNTVQGNGTMSDSMPISDSIETATNSTVSNFTGILAGNSTVLTDSLPIFDSIQTVINSTSLNGTDNTTSLDVVPTIQSTKQSYSITDNPEFTFKIFKDSDLKKIKKAIKQTVQQNGWTEKNNTISVKIIAPNGTEIPLTTKFTKLKEGQFDIKILSKKFGKPGIYTIKTVLVKNGKTFTTQNQYAWGLVSLNTDRSIYKPGQTANMTIVVLDNQGHSVCNALVSMGITNPNGTITSLSTGNGITTNQECGLYNAKYSVSSEGNYTVNVSATANGISTNFSTSFLVQNNFAFDIIRTAQSKIDPINNPNLFNVNIDVVSYANASNITIQESVPSVFDVQTDGVVKTIGDTKIISWNKRLVDNKTSIQYSYTVPLVFPQLYALGPTHITYGNNTFTEARQWFVANDPPAATIVESSTGPKQSALAACTSCSWSNAYSITSGNDVVLILSIATQSNPTISSVTYTDSTGTPTAMTAAVSGISGTGRESNLYYAVLGNVASGWTTTFAFSSSSNLAQYVGATELSGVDQSGTIGKTGRATGTGTANTQTTATLSLTGTPAKNSWVFDNIALSGVPSTAALSDNSGQTNSWVHTSSVVERGGHFKTTGATYSPSYRYTSGGTARNWAMVAAEFIPSGTAILSDPLSLSDSITITTTKSLSESLSISDSLVKTSSKTLTNNLSLADTISTPKTIVRSISDSLSLADTISTPKTIVRSISDSLSLADPAVSILKSRIVQLSDSLSLVDSIATPRTLSRSISDSLSLADSLTKTQSTTISISDSLSLADTISTPKTIVRSISDSLSLADPAVSILKSRIVQLSDSLSLVDSIATPRTLSRSISDSLSLADSLTKNGSTTVLVSDSLTLTDNKSKQITIIKSDNMDMTDSSTAVTNLQSNQELIENNQQSVTIDPNKPELVVTSSSAALSNVTIPSTVSNPKINYTRITVAGSATIDNSLSIYKDTNNNGQPEVTITIPSSTTISGTSWNGLLQLPTIMTSNNLVFPVSQGQVATPNTVIGVGSTIPLTFNQPIRLAFIGQAGIHVGFFHNPPTVTEITSTCTSDSVSGIPVGANECQINVGSDKVVWTKHFTGFGTWSSSSSGSGSGSSGSAGAASIGGGGATGAGPSGVSGTGIGAGTGTSTGEFGGKLSPDLKILTVSYDVCDTNTVKILVQYSDSNPSVILRSSISGIVQTQLSSEQPYAVQNQNSTIQKLVYEAPINSKETSFEVLALQASGNDINSVGKTIDVSGCKDTISYENQEPVLQQVDLQAPQIFNVNYKIGNQTSVSSDTFGYTNSMPVIISAIVNSKSDISKAELRFTTLGKSSLRYNTIPMNVIPLQVSNTTYLVSAVVPSEQLKTPAMEYWIDIQNSVQKTSDSVHYTIGVKPNYDVTASLEIDANSNRAEGTTGTPIAYLTNNGTTPVFGIISLIVDGKVVDTSEPQLFAPGQSQVKFAWHTPVLNQITTHQITAKAMIYDKLIQSDTHSINTFPSTRTVSIPSQDNISTIIKGNSTVAYPSILYSSFKDENSMRYKVTSPDGTCVIGGETNCLVHDSTFGMRGNLKAVTIDNQIYRVRYSGPDSPLERFFITSVDPIVGKWKVEIISQKDLVPHAEAASDVFLKVKYSAIQDRFITEK